MNNKPLSDLDWLAFRYVSDELSVDEREGFESRMLLDQEAREAVASAMEMWVASAAAFEREPVAQPASRARRSSGAVEWFSVIGGVGLLVLLLTAGLTIVAPEDPLAAERTDAEFARLWEEIRSEQTDQVIVAAEAVEEFGGFADEDDLNLESPEWMLAGIVNMSENSDDMNHERDMENR